ncbi:MAG: hypothetical protein AAFV90_19330 [Cyanobacteria bacterium J06634_5]
MYEPSPYEDSRGLRLCADDDFLRSLDQLEDLLEEDLIAATAEHLKQKEAEQQSHRFGGGILDAMPLAERLGARLSTNAASAASAARTNAASTEATPTETAQE